MWPAFCFGTRGRSAGRLPRHALHFACCLPSCVTWGACHSQSVLSNLCKQGCTLLYFCMHCTFYALCEVTNLCMCGCCQSGSFEPRYSICMHLRSNFTSFCMPCRRRRRPTLPSCKAPTNGEAVIFFAFSDLTELLFETRRSLGHEYLPLTPKLMHMLHDFAQISECPTAVAEAAVVNLSLSCGCTVTCQPRVLTIKHKWASRVWT